MAQDPKAAGDKSFVVLPPPPEDTQTSFVSNILAIAGFIIVVVIVIWGLVHLAGISRSWFASFFGGQSGTTLEVTAPESATSGKEFDVTWDYDPSDAGSYAFLYKCEDGLQFRLQNPEGNLDAIPCGAAYTVPTDGNALSLTPFFSGTEPFSTPLSIIFLPTATGTSAQGSTSINILAATSVTPPAPTPTPTPTPPPPAPIPTPTPTPVPTPTPRPSTPADLAVRIISVNPQAYGATSVTFSIANNGGTASGTYYFTASLPTTSVYTYTSPAQRSLAPGASIVSTLRFTQVRSGGGTFSVSVDPSNFVRESNENNNYASQFVNASYYNNTYNPNTYNQYPYNNYNTYNYQYPYQNQYQYTQHYPYAY